MVNETVTLEVLEDYTAGKEYHAAGVSLDVDPAKAAWLLRDAPGCFKAVSGQAALDSLAESSLPESERTIAAVVRSEAEHEPAADEAESEDKDEAEEDLGEDDEEEE